MLENERLETNEARRDLELTSMSSSLPSSFFSQTIQSISLMAYLAEVHDIWGPFLVIAPASTLHNWQQEITRFVPQLKCLPYWGNVKDRATLRKFWNRKQISYNQDAPFHVLITSYQLVRSLSLVVSFLVEGALLIDASFS